MAAPAKKNLIPNWLPLLVTIGLGLTTLICLFIAGTRQLTNTESVLLGVLLSAASMLVSWLATHVYSAISVNETVEQATQAYSDNIRTLGVRAAEKVLNLSNQLQRLVDALSTALDDADEAEGTKQSGLLILRERIQSAIYNIETLKSMNDTFLSDWRGVIGEEIDRQQTLERQIQALSLELRNQIRERELMWSSIASNESLAALENRINETEQRLTEKLTALPFKVGASAEDPLEVAIHRASIDSKRLEDRLLAIPDEFRDRYSDFLQQPDTGIVRLLPRGKYEKAMLMRGGGAYYSFSRLTHEYGHGSDIGLQNNELSVGFAGLDYGFFLELGDVPLTRLRNATASAPDWLDPSLRELWQFFWTYIPPKKTAELRLEQKRFRASLAPSSPSIVRRVRAAVGNTFMLRAINIRQSDIVVAFRVESIESDGSAILPWLRLARFETTMNEGPDLYEGK